MRSISPLLHTAPVLLATLLGACGRREQAPSGSAQVRPAMMVWHTGTNEPGGPTPMVETITRATLGGRPTWRITHYSHDPAADKSSDFDLYDLDAETLAPIRSLMRNPGFELDLAFGRDTVVLRRVAGKDSSTERIALAGPVAAEGPGLEVFVGSLPLRVGYSLRYRMVDRWSGTGPGRLKAVTLSVLGRDRVTTAIGWQDTFEVLIRPDDDAFQIVKRVRALPPHYSLTVKYVRGTFTYLSEVVALAVADDDR